jgi:hypothetical protein
MRQITFTRGEALAKQKLAKDAGTCFACATPAHGYTDCFELFVSVSAPPPYGTPAKSSPCVHLKMGERAEGIPEVKARGGRTIVFCRQLVREDNDPDRRTFTLQHDAPLRVRLYALCY